MPIRLSSVPRFLAFAVFVCALLLGGRARADEASEAQDYVEKQNNRIAALLRQPASAQRDAQITGLLNGYIAYDEVTHRAFGEPCPTAKPCEDHWKALTDPQKTEVADLLKRLVEKNYRKNLIKTLDWEISYKSSKESRDGEYRVKTEAKNKTKPRDPSVQVEYVVRAAGSGTFKIVDIVTEGSSLTKNYYDQFHRMLLNPSQGYAYIVKKLNDRINRKD